MTKFDKVKFVKALKTLPFPVAHEVFLEEQTAPYLIYTDNEFEFVTANSKTVLQKTVIVLELYTKGSQTDEFEEITEIKFDSKENLWYVHNYVTDMELQTNEYWTPLIDMSFDELFKIAERL